MDQRRPVEIEKNVAVQFSIERGIISAEVAEAVAQIIAGGTPICDLETVAFTGIGVMQLRQGPCICQN